MVAISALSVAANGLRTLLQSEIEDMEVGQILIGHPKDTFESMGNDENYLNLFFYNVQFDGYPADGSSENPFYVRLYCLITAVGGKQTLPSAGENDLRLVGEVMRVLHQKPFITVSNDSNSEIAQLQIVPHPLNLDNLNHVWSTQGDTPYRLSVAYEMALAPIPLSEAIEKSPWVGEIGVSSEADVNPDVLPVSGFGIETLSPAVPSVTVDTALYDWPPHVCFVYQDLCAYTLAFELGSQALGDFNVEIWLATDENAIIDLVWERWQSDNGWSILSRRENILAVVMAIDFGASILYAGTRGQGVFQSSDNGQTWQEMATGITDLNIQSLIIDSVTPTTLYAGSIGGGVFKSTDSATNWTSKNSGLTDLNIQYLSIDPTTVTTLYACTHDSGVFKSLDSSDNWVHKSNGLTDLNVQFLAIDLVTPTTLYSATAGAGIFKSIDGADNWVASNTGLSDLNVQMLAVDPLTVTNLYACTRQGGIFKSTDSGSNWTQKNTGLSDLNVQYLAIDPNTPTILYAATYSAGVFKSINGADSWQAVNTNLGAINIQFVAIDSANSSSLFVGSNGGLVFSSEDSANNWLQQQRIPTGLNDKFLSIAPENSETSATFHENLADKLSPGQFQLYAVRRYSPQRDGRLIEARSNPLLVTIFEAST